MNQSGGPIRNPLLGLFSVRPQETRGALLMFTYFFVAMACVTIVKSLQVALYLGKVGFDYRLPSIYAALALLSGLVVFLYRYLGRRYSQLAVVIISLVFFLISVIFFWFLVGKGQFWIYLVFYAWGGLFSLLIPTLGWVTAFELYTTRQAKRLFALFGTGGILGGACGGYYTALVAAAVGASWLLAHVFGLLMVLLGVLVAAYRSSGHRVSRSYKPPLKETLKQPQQSSLSALRGLFTSPYLSSLAGIVFVGAFTTTLIDLYYQWSLERRYPGSETEITEFVSTLLGTMFLFSAFLQLFATLTRPGILVPAKVRENLMEEDKTDANAEVQTGTDRNGAETDRGGHGEWEVDAAGLQGGWDSYSDVLSVAEGVWRSEGGAGQTAEGVGEGKHPVETTGSRAVAGEAGVKGCSGGKLLSPERRRCAVERAEMRYGMSERHACRLLGQSRGTQRYEPMRRADEDRLTAAVVALASEYGRYGYKKIAAMLQRSGWQAGRDRVERIWRREGLKVPQKQRPRRRLWLNDGSCIRLRPERANHVWSYDFVNARTHDGRLLRILALIDEYTRECLALRVARRLNSQDVIETLSEVMLWRGIPEHIRSDNGPEFVARQLRDWLQGLGTSPLYIEPGSPWENGYCESFNGKLREECLNGEIFYSLKEARIVIEQWRQQYNRVRPHAALGYRPPAPGAYTPPWNPVPRPQVIM